MAKFKLLHQLLLDQGLIERKQIHVPLSIARRDLEEIHPRRYHETFSRDQLTRPEQRRIGLPATSALVQRTWLAVGGDVADGSVGASVWTCQPSGRGNTPRPPRLWERLLHF